jgi:predicted Rossmann fold flavoprotein
MYYDNSDNIIVIGGGASGMMAAAVAASEGKKVVLLEKNNALGEKLKITGGGRCNITNNERDLRSFLENYGRAREFLFSPFAQFGVQDTFDYFESRDLNLVVQARNRVFPTSERAWDVYKTLEKELQKQKVIIKSNAKVLKVNTKGDKVVSVETTQGLFEGKSFILATGGVSHPETGSTGDGFKWLKELGHTVKNPTPTIVPIATSDDWSHQLAGVSLTFMKITFFLDGKKQFSKTGKVLFTHFGLSSPLILNSAAAVGELLMNGDVTAQIDAFPETDLGALDDKIVHIFNQNKNKLLKTVFPDLVPQGTVKGIQLLFPEINFDTPVHSVTKDQRKKIVNTLKALPIQITGLMGNDRAVSADGGVVLEEVDMKTMRSKKYDNLYIVGDLLHINRPSGGYSLQLCWTTGFIAGQNA